MLNVVFILGLIIAQLIYRCKVVRMIKPPEMSAWLSSITDC